MYLRPGNGNGKRSPSTLRPLSAELSSLSRSDGSASLHVGNTHILCAVHGPVAPRSSRWESADGGVVSVAFSRGLMVHGTGNAPSPHLSGDDAATSGGASPPIHPATTSSSCVMKSVSVPPPPGLGATERELECCLRDALSSCILLERYPRCVIQVLIQIVQADGCVLGSAVNCAVLALMDAGVAMGGLPVASTCVVIPSHQANPYSNGMHGDEAKEKDGGIEASTIWLDPTSEEEAGEGHAIIVRVTD